MICQTGRSGQNRRTVIRNRHHRRTPGPVDHIDVSGFGNSTVAYDAFERRNLPGDMGNNSSAAVLPNRNRMIPGNLHDLTSIRTNLSCLFVSRPDSHSRIACKGRMFGSILPDTAGGKCDRGKNQDTGNQKNIPHTPIYRSGQQ